MQVGLLAVDQDAQSLKDAGRGTDPLLPRRRLAWSCGASLARKSADVLIPSRANCRALARSRPHHPPWCSSRAASTRISRRGKSPPARGGRRRGLCELLLAGFHRKKLRTIFLSSGSGLTANRKNRSTPRDPILPSTIRSCSPRPAGCYRPLPRPPSTCLRARNICHSLRP